MPSKTKRQTVKVLAAEEDKSFVCEMARRADQHAVNTTYMAPEQAMNYVRDVIDGADIVWGVFEDPTATHGFGMHLIKGRRELQTVTASKKTAQVFLDAISCSCAEQAIAAERELGDGSVKAH